MSTHISASSNDIAPTLYTPGDPLRGEALANEFLTDVRLVNRVRNALTFTGRYKDKLVSIHGTGMGLPNQNIYVTEFIKEYGVKRIIRVGTCGAIQDDIKLGDIIIAIGACTDSGMNSERFNGLHFAPVADFSLLHQAYEKANALAIQIRVGNIFSTDRFHKEENLDWWKKWVPYGVLALEMETTELYTLAAYYKVQALTILTVSDLVPTLEKMNAEMRERGVSNMMRLALELAL